MKTELEVVSTGDVLGRKFTIYGTIEDPLFLAKDVAEWIEHSDVTTMLKNVDEDEKLTQVMFGSGQNRTYWFLTEYGLYEVLMQSRKPIAKQFKGEVKKLLKALRLGRVEIVDKTSESYKVIRTKSKAIRNNFTDTLKQHGYTKNYEYINTTRAMKKELGITNKKDDMTEKELIKISLAEDLSRLLLTDEHGYKEVNPVCVDASNEISSIVRKKITA